MGARLLGAVFFLSFLLVLGAGHGLYGTGAALAAESGKTASRVYIPSPPKGKGDKCVADTDVMRRDHMNLLDHQRDDTVHEGIRTKKLSLKECIDCHAVKGPDSLPVTAENPKHFCRECHDYAAVKIDCFECHASRPEAAKAARIPADHDKQTPREALAGYLRGKSQ